jgi:hypothetical protein
MSIDPYYAMIAFSCLWYSAVVLSKAWNRIYQIDVIDSNMFEFVVSIMAG